MIHLNIHNFINNYEVQRLEEVIERDECEVLGIPNDNIHRFYPALTSQYHVYNWLQNDAVASLNLPDRFFEMKVLEKYDTLYIQCWCNIVREGEKLSKHVHAGMVGHNKFYAANLFISGNTKPGTWYEGIGTVENTPGTLTFFDCKYPHAVPVNKTKTHRISMAFDIWYEKPPGYEEPRWLTFKREELITDPMGRCWPDWPPGE